jgi:hypothetical protein
VEEEPARGRSGVDGVSQALELGALLVQFADQIDQLFDAAPQAIQLPNHQGVTTLAQHFERLGQAWTVGPRAAHLVLKDLLASSLGQGFALQFKILILRRDAHSRSAWLVSRPVNHFSAKAKPALPGATTETKMKDSFESVFMAP